MHRKFPAAVCVVAFALLAAAPAARADGQTSIAVIEMIVGADDPALAGAWSQALERELVEARDLKVVDRSMALARLGAAGVVPMRRLSDDRLDAIDQQIRDGEELLYTDPVGAVALLARAHQELDAAPEAVATQVRVRDLLLRSRMLLARSHLDAGQEDAALGVLAEVIRVFGDDLSVTTRDYHPMLVQAFQRKVQDMVGLKTGSLAVSGDVAGCKVWINGREIPATLPGTVSGLHVGSHLVQVRCRDQAGLLHRVDLDGRTPAKVSVDMPFERAVVVDGRLLGLAFEDVKVAGRMSAGYAARLGRLMGVDRVALHWREIGEAGGDAVMATIDVATGTEIGRTRVAVQSEAVSGDAARLLAKQALRSGSTRAELGGGGWKNNVGAWVLSSVGAAALIVGAVEGGLYFKYKADATKAYDMSVVTREALEPQYESRKDAASKANTAGIVGPVMLGVGAAALVGGIVWFVVDDRADAATAQRSFGITPYWAVDGGGLAANFTF